MSESKGCFESRKYDRLRPAYSRGMQKMFSLDFDKADLVNHFPSFIGHMTLARYLSLYEAYRMTLDTAGHIAEVGVYKASGSLLFAKLIQIFEPQSLTLVHGFDWFKGAKTTSEEKFVKEGECAQDEKKIKKLISYQNCDNIVHIHNFDITKKLGAFFDKNRHLMFKLVFLDCGVYDVVAESIKQFWPRITPGGILMFDHYSHEFAPGEIRAIRELIPGIKIRTFPFGWMPSAYAVKPEKDTAL